MLYNDFSSWLHRQFPDFNVQKIAVDAGFTCPNRDGTLSLGGCSYCNNRAFTPSYCNCEMTIREQIQLGKKFFNKKYTYMKYLVYFQSFTNTYGNIQDLQSKYEEALAEEDVVGIIIGTRPDCISTPLLDYLEALSHRTFLIVEYGIESTNDETLKESIGDTILPVPVKLLRKLLHAELLLEATSFSDFPAKTVMKSYSRQPSSVRFP